MAAEKNTSSDSFDLLAISLAHRQQLLDRVCNLFGKRPVAVLLWLVDCERSDLVLNAYASNVTHENEPQELIGATAVQIPPLTEHIAAATTDWRLTINDKSRVRDWIARHGLSGHERTLAISADGDNGGSSIIAFLHIVSTAPWHKEISNDVALICENLAVQIDRSRERRKLSAVQILAKEWSETLSIEDWLSGVAKMICRTIDAECCLVLRDARGGGFQSVATHPNPSPEGAFHASHSSAIKVIARAPHQRRRIRLRDWDDIEERKKAFGTAKHDDQLHKDVQRRLLAGAKIRSVMMAPVVFEQQALAVIVVINKCTDVHLAGFFSDTDADVLTMVTEYVSGVLPTREMYRALEKLATIVSPRALSNKSELSKIFDVVADVIPGVTGAAVLRKRRGSVALVVDPLGGILTTNDPAVLTAKTNTVSQTHVDGTYRYTKTIDDTNLAQRAYLVVEFTKDALGRYEHQMLGFVSRELTHLLLSEKALDNATAQFIQLRHALRSGLTGVVGYVHEALGRYERYKASDFTVTAFERGWFHKSLKRANFSAVKTHQLLEEPRILLGSISRATLQMQPQSLTVVVSSVLDTLRLYAKARRVEINNDKVIAPDLDDVTLDRSLVEMLIFNVVDNAVKYSHRNQTVFVRTMAIKSDWVLEVVDYGAPIRTEDLEVIFEPYIRRPAGESGLSRPGTGVGLPVAREIAQAHGGSVECRSRPHDIGIAETTFTIRMPRNPGRS